MLVTVCSNPCLGRPGLQMWIGVRRLGFDPMRIFLGMIYEIFLLVAKKLAFIADGDVRIYLFRLASKRCLLSGEAGAWKS